MDIGDKCRLCDGLMKAVDQRPHCKGDILVCSSPECDYESTLTEEPDTFTAAQVLGMLESQPFADWYAKEMDNYITGNSAPTKEKMLENLEEMLNKYGWLSKTARPTVNK